MRRTRCIAVILTAVALSTAGRPTALAQRPDSVSGATTIRPIANAVRRTGPIVVDGRIDEDAWKSAEVIANFRQLQPTEGARASQRTEVRILYDDQAIYIGARLYDSLGARGIRAPLARRDQLLDGNGNNGSFNSLTTDKLAIVFDTYHNRIDRAWFEINPAGARGDEFNGDPSWDPIWEGATHVDSLGWTAEMRIPYSQLRFSRDSVQTWGMQVWRYADRLNERDMWSFWRRNESGGPAFFGTLNGIEIGAQPRHLELLPYVVSREQFKYAAPADPYHKAASGRVNAGGDVKYLLTSNLTLDATVNPDFGQVEVDPATINLSAYETYYDEKRPFFIAGSSAFNFGGMNCNFCSNTSGLGAFYSRRIGRPPQLNGYVDNASRYASTPDNTSILGAAKITGRTAGGYTIGLLDAVTNRETATYQIGGSGLERTQEVEPYANYFVGRVKKDLNAGNTTVGMVLTSTARQLRDTVLSGRLRSHAEATGIDFRHFWKNQEYSWMGTTLVSDVGGSPSAIAATEQSSAHYFQRPDRAVSSDGLFDTKYNTSATSLRGYGFYTRLAKQNGDWLWETAQNWRSPGFETNDLSFLNRADYKWMNANVVRQWTTPTRYYRSLTLLGGGQQQFNYDGDRTDLQSQVFGAIELPSYWNLRAFTIHHPTVFDDRLTRGGPVVKRAGYNFYSGEISTDARQKAVYDISVSSSRGIDANTHGLSVSPGIALKPATNVFVSLSPTFNADEDVAQYVEAVADPTATSFSGTRYVFGFVKSRTLSLDTRINWTFTPDLTLQLYAQPFIASGAYLNFREFAAPRTVQKLVYGADVGTISFVGGAPGSGGTYTVDPDGAGPASAFSFANPDFTVRSFIGNAVLRWEYRPGSTVYFVWTQQRTGSDAVGAFDFTTQRTALFRDRPTNVFQVKMNYWVGQ
ncbi:MAG: carbohydrate binding family 9 domain-containing protein [Gemmatimonadota bacterium]|nr:carbohydrate binding family 9 domain-containing protein [Gemmatimonadota bacterium]